MFAALMLLIPAAFQAQIGSLAATHSVTKQQIAAFGNERRCIGEMRRASRMDIASGVSPDLILMKGPPIESSLLHYAILSSTQGFTGPDVKDRDVHMTQPCILHRVRVR